MREYGSNINLPSLDNLFSSEQERQDAKLEKIQILPLTELHPFRNHPFQVRDDDEMDKMVDSVKEYGVMTPAIVRPRKDGRYEIVAGHRRCHASQRAGVETMPCIVRDMDDDTAIILMVDSNCQREHVYCEVMFSEEISGELPEHNRFIHETAIPYFEQRGIPTRVLRSEKTYLSCFYHVVTRGKTKGMLSGFPLSGRCTIQRDCKLPPIKAYQKALPPDTVQYIGIAADEPKRLARLKPGQISLLDKYHVAEPEARSMCAAEGLLSPLYDFTKRGGCWFCPNASISELRHLYRYHPELWQLLLELQDVPNKPTERFSWRRTFREIDERFRQEGEQLSFYEER